MSKVSIVIGFILLISCQGNEQNSYERNSNLVSSVKNDSTYFKQLDIDELQRTLQSPQIRFWISFSLMASGKIVNLKNEQGGWKDAFYQYRFHRDNTNPSKRVLFTKNMINGIPQSGWEDFLNQVDKLGLYTLNDNGREHNSGLCTDGGVLTVEIVKDKKYFVYKYPCWDAIEDQSQIVKLRRILQAVQNEFGFKVFPLDLEFSDMKKMIRPLLIK